jgi:hypothetical protein
MYQPAVALLKEALGWTHSKATAGIAALGTIGAVLTLWFTQGGSFWSTVDFWVGTYLIFIMAGVQIIYFAWVFGIDRGWKEIHSGASIQIPRVFKFIMKYVAPTYLIIVFIGFTVQNLGPSVRASWADTGSRVAMLTIGATLLLLLWVVRSGEVRWKSEGRDLNDHQPAD